VTFLELDTVHKHYGGLPAVDGVTLGVDEGEILALVGPNGAGKTTLLKLVSGLESPSQGAVRFMGAEVSGHGPHRVRQTGIAMVPQTPRMFPSMTTLENVAMGALFGSVGGPVSGADAGARATAALRFVGRTGWGR
jgi:ABC-type branched-subunit amino acid transport system ATPase component